jgi:hypothetical protein
VKLKTTSELAFESFCETNHLSLSRISETENPTPDYILRVNETNIFVEVKQIDKDENFSSTFDLRSPGSHIRSKINQARNQVREAAQNGNPTVLLIYNNLHPLQLFGTEPDDFLAAMYGDLTINITKKNLVASGVFHGRNQSFREDKNETFSAIGHLYRNQSGLAVHLYQNVYAQVPISFSALPSCIQFNCVEVVNA